MSYDTFKLATHAAATVAGFDVRMDGKGYDEWCLYTPGPHGMKLFKDPNEWLASLHPAGFRFGFYGYENGLPGRYWGLLLDRVDERYFWEASGSTVTEGSRSWRRCRFMAEKSPEFAPPPAFDVRALTEGLHHAIEAMLAFAREYRSHESDHIERLEIAVRLTGAILGGDESVPIPEGLRALYPEVGYARDRMLLGAATFESNIFGGMGSWNDWGSRDPEITRRFEAINGAYGRLTGPCVTAASLVG